MNKYLHIFISYYLCRFWKLRIIKVTQISKDNEIFKYFIFKKKNRVSYYILSRFFFKFHNATTMLLLLHSLRMHGQARALQINKDTWLSIDVWNFRQNFSIFVLWVNQSTWNNVIRIHLIYRKNIFFRMRKSWFKLDVKHW